MDVEREILPVDVLVVVALVRVAVAVAGLALVLVLGRVLPPLLLGEPVRAAVTVNS